MNDAKRIEEYEAYVTQMRRSGLSVLQYDCPGCGATLHEHRPIRAQSPFTTLVQCVYCEHFHHRIASHDGEVLINAGDGHVQVRRPDIAGEVSA